MDKKDLIELVIKPIEAKGGKAYFVGGCVRDQIMEIEPHDYDLVTDATPTELHGIFKYFSEQKSESFGVSMPIVNGEIVEIATMRKDMTKGRHPVIKFTKNIEEDSKRRDFTINAIYEDIDGKLFDFNGGVKHIKNKQLSFVGNAADRVAEDPLRALRFVRFIAAKGLAPVIPEYEFEALIKLTNSDGFYAEVSKERILKELIGVLGGKYFMTEGNLAIYYMQVFGILKLTGIEAIFKIMQETMQNPKWHSEGSVFKHTMLVMKEMAKVEHDWIDMLSALLHDIGKPECAKEKIKKHETDAWYVTKLHDTVGAHLAEDFCKSLGMSNKDCIQVANIVLHHMDMHHLGEFKSKYKILKLMNNPDFDRLIKLCRCDTKGSICTEQDKYKTIDEALEIHKDLIGVKMPAPIVTGHDLIESGCVPNPNFSKALDVAYKVQIDQDITEKRILLSNVLNIAKGK